MAYVSRPAVALPSHRISTADIVAEMEQSGGGRDLAASLRIVRNLGVQDRYATRPLSELARPEGIGERNRWVTEAVYELGERAARTALESARLEAGQIDALIAIHSSGIAMPGLGVHVANSLGLRADVLHVPVMQVGCTAGAWGLAVAEQMVAARPGRRVLLVIAEALTSCYRPDESGIIPAMYRALFADSGAACVISGDWRGPGLRIDDGWSHLLPDSADVYWMDVGASGQHFDSAPAALTAAARCMPAMVDWLKDSGHAMPRWVAAHPGGPRIIQAVEEGLPQTPDLTHSWDSLREHGNPGGPAVLDVLRRVYGTPPAHGAAGLVCGFGPGFFAAAVRGTWQEHPEP